MERYYEIQKPGSVPVLIQTTGSYEEARAIAAQTKGARIAVFGDIHSWGGCSPEDGHGDGSPG